MVAIWVGLGWVGLKSVGGTAIGHSSLALTDSPENERIFVCVEGEEKAGGKMRLMYWATWVLE